MSGQLTALTNYTVRHAATLKWLPIVFARLIQSQRIVTVTKKYGTATARLQHGYSTATNLPYFSPLIRNLIFRITEAFEQFWKSSLYICQTDLARLTRALCPPLNETPRSPTNVMSPSERSSISFTRESKSSFGLIRIQLVLGPVYMKVGCP
jgi:hypothetical protein